MKMKSVALCNLIIIFSTIHAISGLDLAPPTFREKPTWPDRSYYDEDGPPFTLNCQITNITHRLIWKKNGRVLDLAKEQLLLQEGNQTLIFEDPKQFQSGLYKCLAYNAAGNVSHTGNILITARKQETRPKVIEIKPVGTVKHAEVGDTVNISCTFDVGGSVEALMDLVLAWYKGEEAVNDTTHTTYGLNTTFENNKISSLNIDKLEISDYGTYTCFGENSKGNDSRLITIAPPEKNPKDFRVMLIIGCSVGVTVIASLVAIAVICRHRYKLRQKYEDLEWVDPDMSQYEVPDRQIEYDVFISYSSDDLKWVKDVLFYKLCNHGYNVCIDFKDFTPGVAIAENIIDAIYKSHKTIVLMSKNFLKSMWGQFELQQAHNRAIMQRSDGLILIKFDKSKVPAKLMGKTFLDWSDSKIQPHFWTRLFEAIGEPAKFLDAKGEPDDEKEGNNNETGTDANGEPASYVNNEENSGDTDTEKKVTSENLDDIERENHKETTAGKLHQQKGNVENIETCGEIGENIETNGEHGENIVTNGEHGENIETNGERGENIETNGECGENIETNGERGENIETNGERGGKIEKGHEFGENIKKGGEFGDNKNKSKSSVDTFAMNEDLAEDCGSFVTLDDTENLIV